MGDQATDAARRLWVFSYTRGSIFLGAGLSASMAALVWAIRALLRKRRDQGGHSTTTSIFLLSLLLCDLFQMIMTITMLLYIRTWWGSSDISQHHLIVRLWGCARACGLLFHQMVALEEVLSLMRPQWSARLRSAWFTLPVSLAVWLLNVVLTVFLPMSWVPVSLLKDLVSAGLALASWIFSCGSRPVLSDRAQQHCFTVRSVALFTLLALYGPAFTAICAKYVFGGDLGYALSIEVGMSLANLRLITDPILCVLVCRGQHLHG